MAEEKTDFEAPLALVTGVTGFIAGHVCHQLIQAGWRVRGTSRSTTGARVEMVKKLGSPGAIEIVAGKKYFVHFKLNLLNRSSDSQSQRCSVLG